jgi:DNA-directed RNA polymerase II subunit RPB1
MPSGFNVPSSDTETVVGVQFGIFSPEEIERRSVVEITRSDAPWEGSEPKIGGLFDPRMGVLENGKTCRSCGLSNHGCPGHFGHYKLTRPVYWIQFLPTVLNVLRCVCIRCSKLLIEKDNHRDILRRKGEDRWNSVKKHCMAIQRCGQETEDGCGAPQPKSYIKEGIARIVAQMPGVGNQPLEIEYVLRLLRRITDEDVDFMGLSRFWCRPDWMVCTVLPIPPPQDRPSIVQDNNQRSEDDLTHKLFEIIKTDKTLAQKIENNATKSVIDEWTNVLQYHVATLVDNQIPGVAPSAQRSGRPLKSIQQRLGSKEGRIRYNIQGKRVEFSARSVITPDPNISIGELGVPLKIAMNLTYPERVTTFNIDRLYKFIQNGADTYPGAKTISRQNGSMISLRHINTRELRLYPGDVVHRHLMDGDVVLFNRQPTLHRPSMMGHRVRVLPYNTFRLNVSVCKSYNADFDGDEMNMHVPQSYEASVELAEIAAVHQQIITPRDAKPLIGVEQDTLVGAYRITRPNNTFNLREFMNLMMWNRRFDGNMQAPRAGDAAAPKWTGHQVLTTIMPPINMSMANSSFDDSQPQQEQAENTVRITEGNIEQGVFDKSIFSKASKGIIHTTYNDYGPKAAVEMIDCLQNTLEAYLVLYGFSVGISDLVADDDTKVRMDAKIQARKKEIEEVLLQIHQDLFDNNTGKTNQEEFESRVFAALNKATEESGKIGQGSLAKENRITAMVRAVRRVVRLTLLR